MMSLPPIDADAFAFQTALKLWDRPERELGGKPLDEGADVDAFVEAAFQPGKLIVE